MVPAPPDAVAPAHQDEGITVYDERASKLPAEALVTLILREGKVIRDAQRGRTAPMSREGAVVSARFELQQLMGDRKWNPSARPLSEEELEFASSILADHAEFATALKAQLEAHRDRAWDSSVSLGLYVEREKPLTLRESAAMSKAELAAHHERSEVRTIAQHREMTSQLGELWKDWTYVSLGGAGRTFDVYCTRATAPEVFAISTRIGALRGQRAQWLRGYFVERRPHRPDYLPTK